MFSDAAGWNRPPYSICQARRRTCCGARRAEAAQAINVARLVFAHVGKPTIRALDVGKSFPFGDLGQERTTHELTLGATGNLKRRS